MFYSRRAPLTRIVCRPHLRPRIGVECHSSPLSNWKTSDRLPVPPAPSIPNRSPSSSCARDTLYGTLWIRASSSNMQSRGFDSQLTSLLYGGKTYSRYLGSHELSFCVLETIDKAVSLAYVWSEVGLGMTSSLAQLLQRVTKHSMPLIFELSDLGSITMVSRNPSQGGRGQVAVALLPESGFSTSGALCVLLACAKIGGSGLTTM